MNQVTIYIYKYNNINNNEFKRENKHVIVNNDLQLK